MACTKEYKDFIVDQMDLLDDVVCRSMMGGYLFYFEQKLFGGLYDDRLLVKIVPSNQKYQLEKQAPYQGAKEMYFVENVDDKEFLRDLILDTCKDLTPKVKKED